MYAQITHQFFTQKSPAYLLLQAASSYMRKITRYKAANSQLDLSLLHKKFAQGKFDVYHTLLSLYFAEVHSMRSLYFITQLEKCQRRSTALSPVIN